MLADGALGSAIQTPAAGGPSHRSTSRSTSCGRCCRTAATYVAHGRVRHAGRTIAVAEAEVVNADGKPVALATGSAMILPGRPAALDA